MHKHFVNCRHIFPDARSLQTALNEIIVRLGANSLDVHRARLILHSLQLASTNLSQIIATSRWALESPANPAPSPTPVSRRLP